MAGLLGSGARVGVAAWGCAGCWPRGVTAPTTASPAAAPMLGWSASARWPVLARCPIQAPNAGSTASSVPWSAREAKVPGHDPSGTAIQGRGRVRLATARAGALRRARPPRRREGFLCVREREERKSFSVFPPAPSDGARAAGPTGLRPARPRCGCAADDGARAAGPTGLRPARPRCGCSQRHNSW